MTDANTFCFGVNVIMIFAKLGFFIKYYEI